MSDLCLRCGACCAHYRVSFYWAESDAAPGGVTPADLTVSVQPLRLALRGTESRPVRCVALEGTVGEQVGCRIYARRPSPCHEVEPGDERCRQARAAHGLPPPDPSAAEDAQSALPDDRPA